MKRCLLCAIFLLPVLVHADDLPGVQRVTISAVRDAQWGSYRRAYKAAAFFETFTRSRPLIQAHMQIRPLKEGSMEGLHLQLSGEKTSLEIAVDGIGRAAIPMLKQAYDEDAVLRLNRPQGEYYFSGRYSIKERVDGIYGATEMHSACDQLLSAQRESGYRFRLLGKKCAGVKFVYARSEGTVSINFKDEKNQLHAMPLSEEAPFEDNSMGKYKVAVFRFSDWTQAGAVIAISKPLAIGSLYE